MRPEELAAYIGATAWLPQIASWIYKQYVKPEIIIVPDKYAEVGFTTNGPILNFRMMITSKNKSLIIDGFELFIKHSDGDEHKLRWSGLLETFSEITDNEGNKQVVSKDQTPIAIAVSPESLSEKFIRFQEPKFHESDRDLKSSLIAHFNFLLKTFPNEYREKILSSKELTNVTDNGKEAFWWKSGRYEIKAAISSSNKFILKFPQLKFDITNIDVENLNQNISLIKNDLENVIQQGNENFEKMPINWNWANVNLDKS